MCWSVLTVLTLLCLTGHLPQVTGQPQTGRDPQDSEAAHHLTLLSVADEGRGGSDGRWNASLPGEKEAPHTLKDNTTTPPPWNDTIISFQGDAIAAPTEHLNYTIDSPEIAITTPPENVITIPPENVITTPPENVIIMPPENVITTPQEITIHDGNFITTPEYITPLEDNILSTPHQNTHIITTPVEEKIHAHQPNTFITPEENITTTQAYIITTPQEGITTISYLEEKTTLQKDITTSQEHGGGGGKNITLDPVLEDGLVRTSVDQFVICSCPEPTADSCRHMLSGITIDTKDTEYQDMKISVSDVNIVVHNVTCQKEDHRQMNFSEGQFFFRPRGDIVLRNVGSLNGLRINDFCGDLRPDNMKWTLKACIPPPSVPRCCPVGQAMKDGECQPATVPALLKPPMSADLHEKAISWPLIKNHYLPLTCTKDPLKSLPLAGEESKLMVLPTGLLHIWRPADGHITRKYSFTPDMCVDGQVDASGSVVYSANICHSDPEDVHHRVCDGHICIRKCCPEGKEMSLTVHRCVNSTTASYKTRFTNPPDEYRTVYGKPLCPFQTVIDSATLDSKGQFHLDTIVLSAKEYCVDKFSDGRGTFEDKTMICLNDPSWRWVKVRAIAFPICKALSVVFLLLTGICYCLLPVLLQGGGWFQLFHVLSLMFSYTFMFMQEIFSRAWDKTTCFRMGIILQFGFLATFFWLNVLCFEVWRKIRSLSNLRPASMIPIWVYMLYAFGIPFVIGIVTVCMHFFAPDDVPGIVKPRLAEGRCFFPDNPPLFSYFYGPIAFLFALNIIFITHTYWTYRKFEKNASILKKNFQENNAGRNIAMEHVHRKRDYLSDFKQQFSLLVLMSTCWISEVLSMVIPPIELWALTDLLNSLQGVFIFFIFVANRSKRKHLKKKFPLIFKMSHSCCCHGCNKTCLAPINSFTSQISRKLSSSSVVSNLSTLSSSLKFSSSFSISRPDDSTIMKPSVFETDGGITILSHSSLKIHGLPPHESGDAHC